MIEHVLKGLLPSGRGLPEKAPSLAPKLADIVGRPLSVDVRELPKVDQYVVSCYEQKGYKAFDDLQNPEFFEPLFAFVGEAIIKATGGEWRMNQSEEFDVWEPWVVRRVGDHFAGYELIRVCKLFNCPDAESFSIADLVYYMLKVPERLPLDQFG
jgi:hypothetical protein